MDKTKHQEDLKKEAQKTHQDTEEVGTVTSFSFGEYFNGVESITDPSGREKNPYSSVDSDLFPEVYSSNTNTNAQHRCGLNQFIQGQPVAITEFMNASSVGNISIINKYLVDGGNPDVHDELNRTALHLACLEGHSSVVNKLLEQGADINLQDRLGSVAMHWACRGGSLRVVKALRSHGADLNVRDKLCSTPLHVATRTGYITIVEYLLLCGAHINSTDWEGDTPLHDAVRLNRYKIVKLLILAGADTNVQNHEGQTAMQQVKQWQVDILDTLKKFLKQKDTKLQTSASTSD